MSCGQAGLIQDVSLAEVFGFNQNLAVVYNEHHLKFAFKVGKPILFLYLKTGHTKITCKATETSRQSLHFHMTSCAQGIKVNFVDLKKVATSQVMTKLSITRYREISVVYQSKGVDFKRIGGFLLIMAMLAGLIFIMSKRGNSRKKSRLKYKELSKNK